MELKNLVENYQLNPGVLKAMAEIEVLATVGPSASGKTTLMNELAKTDTRFDMVVDETTREPRPEEVPGRDFIFISMDKALEDIKAGNLVQAALGPNGDVYCSRPSSYMKSTVGLIALVPAAVRQFRRLPIKSFKAAFIVPATFDSWLGWLDAKAQASGWDEAKRAGRLAEAKASYKFALGDSEMKFVLNDEISKAVSRLAQAAGGNPDDAVLARQTAEANYQKLLKL